MLSMGTSQDTLPSSFSDSELSSELVLAALSEPSPSFKSA